MPGGARKLLLVVGLGSWAPASAQAALPGAPDPGVCAIELEEASGAVKPPRPPEAQEVSSPPPKGRPSPEKLAPPQEREIVELGPVLKSLANPATSAAVVAGMDAGRPFSPERFAVLVGDVRSIVAHLHALEFLQELSKTKGIGAETRQRLEHDARAIGECAPSRFTTRGGPLTFKQLAGWVGQHRSELEPFLFESPEPLSSQTQVPPPRLEKSRARP